MAMQRNPIPLVLLPGSLCDASMWAPQVEALADCVRCNVIGYGTLDSVESMAASILSAAPAPRFALAGFSLGGFVALHIARVAPERLLGLAVLDSSARPDVPANPARLANMAAFAENPVAVLEKFAALVLGPNTPAAIAVKVRETMLQYGPELYLPQQRAMMTRPDARITLGQIVCPAIVVCGGEDRATPPELSREIAAGIPKSSFTEIAGVGHMTTLEAPQEVNRALRSWIDRIGEEGAISKEEFL